MENLRKKILIGIMVMLIVFVAGACENKSTDNAAPVISGVKAVFIDRETDTLDLFDGVVAIDEEDSGVQTDVTENVTVTLPSQATRDGNKVKFNQCGDYEIKYSVKDNAGNETVVNRLVKVRNIYNLYWLNATLPVLYSALDMVTNNYKSMLLFTRTDTINIDALDKERFFYVVNGASDANMKEANRLTAKIANEDQYSYFRLFLCDTLSHIELFSFMPYNIPSYRYEVKLVSDGSLTYSSAFPYRDENAMDMWSKNAKLYNGIYDKALRKEFKFINNDYVLEYENFIVKASYTNAADLSQMAIMAAQRPNTELWCAYPETLDSADSRVQAEIDKAHMPKMEPDVMYEALSNEQKNEFLKIVNFDKDEFDKNYFDKDGDYLIVTGTNPFSGSFTDEEFADILNRIGNEYSDYNILYKPHPSAVTPPSDFVKVNEWLTENNVKILPGRLPMEVISWVYSDVAMGGFDSSLFMSVPQGNTKFFIAESADSLSVLTKQLYNDGVFGTPEFYWKTAAND